MRVEDRIVIVGAGPVGLSCALFLVEKGIPVTVLEAASDLSTDMRASTFHPPTLDMLAPFDVADRLIAEGHQAPRWQFLRTDVNDAVVFDLAAVADLTAHPYRLQCEQTKLTRIVVDTLAANPLFEIVYDAPVEQVEESARVVQARASVKGRPMTFEGGFLIGADGAKSNVRKSLGLEFKGETYPIVSITVSVDFPFHEHLPHVLNVNYIWTATDHYSLMRTREGWRSGFAPQPGQSIDAYTSDEYLQWHLQRILPTGKPYRLTHKGTYSVHRRAADTFRVGRVLLAGDAAHLTSPSGGMGMNSGIHDAHNLAGKLRRVYGGADESLLDQYTRQRRTVAVEDIQVQSEANQQRHRETDATARDKHWADLKMKAADPARTRAFLRESSMLASVAKANAIT